LRLQLARGADIPQTQQNLPGGQPPVKADFSVTEGNKTVTLKTAELQLSVARESRTPDIESIIVF
jgi:hypothetical protein